MSDFSVNELTTTEGLWGNIHDYLVFVATGETIHHKPKELLITHYEVHNCTNARRVGLPNQKKWRTYQEAVKDATKKLAPKAIGYEYRIMVHTTWNGTPKPVQAIAFIRKDAAEFTLQIPNIRMRFANGVLKKNERIAIKNATIPSSWEQKQPTKKKDGTI